MLQKVKNKIIVFLTVIIFVFFLLAFLPYYFFPADVLRNLPSFSQDEWHRPKNSLLSDPVYQFEPWRQYTKSRILKGEFPLWNDKNGAGAPFFANPQTQVLYPLNALYYLFPAKNALLLTTLLKITLFFLFTYLYLKAIKCSSVVSIFGASVACFSGFFIVWLLWPHTNVFVFLPLLLFLTEKIYDSRKATHRWYIFISVTYLLAILGGHPETLFHITIVHILYILFRLRGSIRNVFFSFLSIFLGFLLGSIQLLPFIEYLSQGFVLDKRLAESMNFYLPLKSFLFNIVPFLYGAPHLMFYKPIAPFTNFQETIGGYIGPALFLLALYSFYLFKKERLFLFWALIAFLSWFISYGIGPFQIFSQLAGVKSLANHRLIGIAGFSLIVLSSLGIEKLIVRKITIRKSHEKFIYMLLVMIIAGIIGLDISLLLVKLPILDRIISFLLFLTNHLFLLAMTTLLFVWLLFQINKGKINQKKALLLIIPILVQTLYLFFSYNPFIDPKDFYPETALIKKLESLPKGRILEVGNPSLPANINLIYGLEHAENNDAIEVSSYRREFDRIFPTKNQWKNKDAVTAENLRSIGITYIVSDYNLLFTRDSVQIRREKILEPITSQNPKKAKFVAKGDRLDSIRILTANFNRSNTCMLKAEIFEFSSKSKLAQSIIPCLRVRDFMFYTISFFPIKVTKGEKYEFMFSSEDGSFKNSVALWGSKKGEPYFEVFYKPIQLSKDFVLLSKQDNLYLWKVENVQMLGPLKSYSLLIDEPEYKMYKINVFQNAHIEVKQTNFTGWRAKIDGKMVRLENSSPFMSIFVNKGIHALELSYEPLSFYLGLSLSIITFLSILAFFIRQEKKEDWFKRFNKSWMIMASAIEKKTRWWEHAIVLFFGFLISLSLYALLIKFLSIKFVMPQTTAINWLTVHNYPKQQDYFYFFLGSTLIFLGAVCLWLLWICWKVKRV